MAWRKRHLGSFPAHFGRVLIEAATYSPRPVLFGSYSSIHQARRVAEEFRHFRFCLRTDPDSMPKLTEIEKGYQLRLAREEEYDLVDRWFTIYLTASPDRLSDLENLNPHLVPMIAEIE